MSTRQAPVKCTGFTLRNVRCNRTVTSEDQRCYHHPLTTATTAPAPVDYAPDSVSYSLASPVPAPVLVYSPASPNYSPTPIPELVSDSDSDLDILPTRSLTDLQAEEASILQAVALLHERLATVQTDIHQARYNENRGRDQRRTRRHDRRNIQASQVLYTGETIYAGQHPRPSEPRIPENVLDLLVTSVIPRSDDTCCICMEAGSEISGPVKLGCAHVYCKGCIRTWTLENNSCPSCRTLILT